MGWPKGKKRGPKQPIPDADNPPKKIRVTNKKSKKGGSGSAPQSNQSLENAERVALQSTQSLKNAVRVIAAVASGKIFEENEDHVIIEDVPSPTVIGPSEDNEKDEALDDIEDVHSTAGVNTTVRSPTAGVKSTVCSATVVIEKSLSSPNSVVEKSFPSPKSVVEKNVSSPKSVVEKNVPSPKSVVEKNVPSPNSVVEKSVPSPKSVVEKDVPSPKSVVEKDVTSPRSVVEKSVPSQKSVVEKSLSSPTLVVDKSLSSPKSVVEKSLSSPKPAVEKNVPSHMSVVEKSVPSPNSVVEKCVPSKQSVVEKSSGYQPTLLRFFTSTKPSNIRQIHATQDSQRTPTELIDETDDDFDILPHPKMKENKSSASSTSTGKSSHSGSSTPKDNLTAKASEKGKLQKLTFEFDPPSEVINELLDEAEEEVRDRQEQFRRKMQRHPDADPIKVAAQLDHGYTVKEFTAKLLRAGYTSEQLAQLRLGRQGARNTKKKTAINGGEKAYILRIVQTGWKGLPGDKKKNKDDVDKDARAAMRAVLNYESRKSKK